MTTRIYPLCLALLLLAFAATHCAAQGEVSLRLSDQEPFDRITLDAENQNAVFKVEPLNLPDRRVPANPKPEDRLRVQLYAQPDKTYEIAWKHIAKLELFEEMLLAEVQQAIAQDRLDDAYDALQLVKQSFPNTPGLDAQIQAYLYVSAGRLFRQQRWPEALAVMEELHKLNPDYKLSADARPLPQVLTAVLEKMFAEYVAKPDYRTARLFLQRIGRDYGERYPDLIARWDEQLKALAAKEQEAAQAFVAAGKFREATVAVRKMLEIAPDVEGGSALAEQVASRYPLVAVGVTQLAKSLDMRRVDDWAARRAGRLTMRQLVEYLKPGPEGGQYAFRYGSLQISEDRRRLTLQLDTDALPPGSQATGYDLATRLLNAAQKNHDDYSPTYASLVQKIAVVDVMRIEIDLNRPYVVPEATLQLPWNPSGNEPNGENTTGTYRAAPVTNNEQAFLRSEEAASKSSPAEITERWFADPATAMAALRRGEIDVIDRVFPADIARLSGDSSLVVGRYALPTLHFLVPSPDRPFAQNSAIRRAIGYAIPRDTILNDQILGGSKVDGCRLLDGPFSPGTSDNDPLAYADDPQIKARAYDPRLAATLISLVERQRKDAADKKMEPVQPLAIVIGYPQSEVARVACQSISDRLTKLGLPTTLKELPLGETRDPSQECDFVYAEVTMGEPVIDARRLLGQEGATRSADPHIGLALRRLDESINWTQAQARLRDVHRIVHSELTVIPLWQIVEHYAFRQELKGLGESTVYLYEDVQNWQRDTAAIAARARAKP